MRRNKPKKSPYDKRKKYSSTHVFMNFLDHVGLLSLSLRKLLNKGAKFIDGAYERPLKVIKGTENVDDAVVRRAQKCLDSTVLRYGGFDINAQLFWTAFYPAFSYTKHMAAHVVGLGPKAKIKKEIMEQFELLDTMFRIFKLDDEMLDCLYQDTFGDLYRFTRRESTLEGIYSFNINDDNRVVLSRAAKIKTFSLPDGNRTAYGMSYAGNDIEWLKLDMKPLGPKLSLPLFIHRHVVDRMIERLSLKANDPANFAYLIIWDSLRKPMIFKHDSMPCDTFLLACTCKSYKVGYFVCQIVGNAVLASTFLFLTMDGTPEGDNLKRTLRLRRQDKEYLGLDHIDAFLHSDMQSDAYLVALMKECGCDHIFALKDKGPSFGDIQNVAAEMRRYLRPRSQKFSRRIDELARALEAD